MKTIKEIADNLGVSKQSIRNEIERQGLRKGLQQTAKGLFIDDEQERLILTAFAERQQKQECKGLRKGLQQGLQQGLRSELPPIYQKEFDAKNEQIAALNAQIERLQQETAALNATIQIQAENMKALTAANESMSAALARAQALHAGTIQERLETEKDKETETEKKTVWQRLFRR